MRVRKRKTNGPSGGNGSDSRERREIEADVLEIWIGVSRLMARLTEAEPVIKRPARRSVRPIP